MTAGPGQQPRIVLAANRGPVTFRRLDTGEYAVETGVGSLAGSLRDIARRLPGQVAWLAAAAASDRAAWPADCGELASRQVGYAVRFVPVRSRTYDRYYRRVSNRMLWFANHALWREPEIDPPPESELTAWRLGYEPVNRAFARSAAGLAHPASPVMFQDYHLAAAPQHLRRLRPEQPIAHFTHSAFSGAESLARLPGDAGRRYLEGMLGADLVGFHTAAWCRSFLDCCAAFGLEADNSAGRVRLGGRWAWVRPYPMQVDAAALRDRAAGASVRTWAARFSAPPGRLLVRVDRIEPAKNIIRGFDAFELLLDRRPDLRDTRFLACLYGTRDAMAEYRRHLDRIRARVAGIQRRYPGSVEMFVEDSQDRALGALLCYNVLLVNPLLDGMNLVAKEGAALNERCGVLVLSSGAGAFAELGQDAVGIRDPESVPETASALEHALCLPSGPRARRAARLRVLADRYSPADWLRWQLTDLESIRHRGHPASPAAGPSRASRRIRDGNRHTRSHERTAMTPVETSIASPADPASGDSPPARGPGRAGTYLARTAAAIAALDPACVEAIVDRLLDAYRQARRVFVAGNGGSAATATHMACDLSNNVIMPPHCRLRVISMTDNAASMSAIANDRGYERVFVDQLMCLAEPGDVLVAVSTSGDSENVIRAMAYGRSAGLTVLALLGSNGGRAAGLADDCVIVPDAAAGHVEDTHIAINHAIVESLRDRLAALPGRPGPAAGSAG